MNLEESLIFLEPMLEVFIENKEELLDYDNMIKSSLDCFVIKTKNGLVYDLNDVVIPDSISVYKLDCNFFNAYINNKDKIKIINPKLNKMWLSSTDTRFDFAKVLEDIKNLRLSGFLEIQSKFLNIYAFMYFKQGNVINIKFNDIEKEQALPILIKSISGKVFNLNFFYIPDDIVEIYASSFKLESIEEDENITNIAFLSKNKQTLFQGMFPSGYFHIYIEDGKTKFMILNDKIVKNIDIYEPFYLAIFSMEKHIINIDLDKYLRSYKSTNVLVKPTSIDKNFIFFCPFCWNPVPQDAIICPHCNASILSFTKLPYDIKLIIALSHPIAEYRILALNIIKSKKVNMAKAFVKSLILNDDNPIVIQKAIETITNLDEPDLCNFLNYISKNHEYGVVKGFAGEIYRRRCL